MATKRKVPKRSGRTPEFADDAFEYIIDSVRGGALVCDVTGRPDEPSYAQLMRWLSQDEDRRKRYNEARADGAVLQLERSMQRIEDDSDDLIRVEQTYFDSQGNERTRTVTVMNHARLRRDELMMKSAQWYAQRIHPDYSDKQRTEHAGNFAGLVIGDTSAAAEVARKRIADTKGD